VRFVQSLRLHGDNPRLVRLTRTVMVAWPVTRPISSSVYLPAMFWRVSVSSLVHWWRFMVIHFVSGWEARASTKRIRYGPRLER
jgi:hypothetical protein